MVKSSALWSVYFEHDKTDLETGSHGKVGKVTTKIFDIPRALTFEPERALVERVRIEGEGATLPNAETVAAESQG